MTTDPTEEGRWQHASQQLWETEQRRQQARPHGRTLLVLLTVGLVVALVLALLIGTPLLLAAFPGSRPTPIHVGRVIADLALPAVALLWWVGLVARSVLDGRYAQAWSAPYTTLSRPQRRQLLRQATGRSAVPMAHLPLARDLARRLARSDRLLFAAGYLPLGLGLALQAQDTPILVIGILMLATGIIIGTKFWLQRQQARRFLSATGGPPGWPQRA